MTKRPVPASDTALPPAERKMPKKPEKRFHRLVDDAVMRPDNLSVGYYVFNDLKALGIAPSRSSLLNLQRRHGFPQAVKVGRSTLYVRAEVHEWFQEQGKNRVPIHPRAPSSDKEHLFKRKAAAAE